MQHSHLTVLGLPLGDAPPLSADILASCDVLCGFPATLKAVQPTTKALFCLYTPLERACRHLEHLLASGFRVLVLASGDPLYFGLGARLARLLPKERITILPAPSALQLACARLALPWHRLVSVSLHGRTNWAPFNQALQSRKPVCVLTDAASSPTLLADYLEAKGYACTLHVFTHLGYAEETHHVLRLPRTDTSHPLPTTDKLPTTVVLVPDSSNPTPLVGFPDTAFTKSGAYCTHRPNRALALSLLALKPDDVLWDIGAGTGALSLEAVPLLTEGAVYAFEEKKERFSTLTHNLRTYGGYIVTPIHGHAPNCCADAPRPNAIFVGGGLATDSSDTLLRTLTDCLLPGGRLVLSCIRTASLHQCTTFLTNRAWPWTATLSQTAESKPLANDIAFIANNPVTLVAAHKPV